MTREQAIHKTRTHWEHSTACEWFIDSLVDLGLLQLSEPETDKIEKLLQHIGANRTAATFQKALDYFDLKIVEK